jgi:hypothetical protein
VDETFHSDFSVKFGAKNLSLVIIHILPNWKVITRPSKIADMIWVSELGKVDVGNEADHYLPACREDSLLRAIF